MTEKEIKKPIDIVQELIAIHSTRIESATRLKVGELNSDLNAIATQSKECIDELLIELANYGDAVQSTAERNNEYQNIWKKNLSKLDTLNEEESNAVLNDLEQSLKNFYQEILSPNNTLGEPLLKILTKQEQVIQQ